MNRRIIFLVSAVLVCACTEGGKVNEKSDKPLGPVHKIVETVYQSELPVVITYEYDRDGKLISCDKEEPDYPFFESEFEEDSTFNAAGQLIKVRSVSEGMESERTFEYEDGLLVREVYSDTDGDTAQKDYTYDSKGRILKEYQTYMGKPSSVVLHYYTSGGEKRVSSYLYGDGTSAETHTFFDKEGNAYASRDYYVDEDGGMHLDHADTTWRSGQDGRMHKSVNASQFDFEYLLNSKGRVESLECVDKSGEKVYSMSLSYADDELTVLESECTSYDGKGGMTVLKEGYTDCDIHGNWITAREAPEYTLELDGIDQLRLESYLFRKTRDIEYYDDIAADKYSFNGNVDGAAVSLNFQRKDDMVMGTYYAAGVGGGTVAGTVVNGEYSLYAFGTESDVVAVINGRVSDGGFVVRCSSEFGNWSDVRLYNGDADVDDFFSSVDAAEYPGIYEYYLPDGSEGQIDCFRSGENWERLGLSLVTRAGRSGRTASDKCDFYFEDTEYIRYAYNGQSWIDYRVRFFGDFAFVTWKDGNRDYFGKGVTVLGVYRKLPAVG